MDPGAVAPAAVQLLHLAAHVDAIVSWIDPALAGGHVILDRYWWSTTYAYARDYLGADEAWALVAAEQPFWRPLPRPTVVYLTRAASLKGGELNPGSHRRLDGHYREVTARERSAGVEVHDLANDGEPAGCWRGLPARPGLPDAPLGENGGR